MRHPHCNDFGEVDIVPPIDINQQTSHCSSRSRCLHVTIIERVVFIVVRTRVARPFYSRVTLIIVALQFAVHFGIYTLFSRFLAVHHRHALRKLHGRNVAKSITPPGAPRKILINKGVAAFQSLNGTAYVR